MEDFNFDDNNLPDDNILGQINLPDLDRFIENVNLALKNPEINEKIIGYIEFARRIRYILFTFNKLTHTQSRSLFIVLYIHLLKTLKIRDPLIDNFDVDAYLEWFIVNILNERPETIIPFSRHNTSPNYIKYHFSLAFIWNITKLENLKDGNVYLGVLSQGSIYMFGRVLKLSMMWDESPEELSSYIKDHFGVLATDEDHGVVSPDMIEKIKDTSNTGKIIFLVEEVFNADSPESGKSIVLSIQGVLNNFREEEREEIARQIIVQTSYDNTLIYNDQESKPTLGLFVYGHIRGRRNVIIDMN